MRTYRAGPDWSRPLPRPLTIPDVLNHPGMWRSVKVDGILSDTANLSWSKDNVMAQAVREVAWNAANYPQKCPVKRGSRDQKSPPIRLNAA